MTYRTAPLYDGIFGDNLPVFQFSFGRSSILGCLQPKGDLTVVGF